MLVGLLVCKKIHVYIYVSFVESVLKSFQGISFLKGQGIRFCRREDRLENSF